MRRVLLTAIPSIFSLTMGAYGQANENAITDAEDAFGFTNGDESVGIYSEQSVRGFNLESAGNYRVNGRYFVKSSGTSSFFLEANTVRIGYNTFAVDLPGPSGVVDYKLRDPDHDAPSLLTTGLNAFGSPYMDFLYKHRSKDNRFSAAAGVGLEYDGEDHQGGKSSSWLLAGTARWNLSDLTKLQFFGGEYSYRRHSQFRLRTDGTHLPRKVKRGVYSGQDWAEEKGERRIAGLLWDHKFENDWELGGVAVFSQEDPTRAYSQFYTVEKDGAISGNTLVVSPHQKATAWSGELTLGKRFTTGDFEHNITVHGRWRASRNRFGGETVTDLGHNPIGQAAPPVLEELNNNQANLRDKVDQYGLGIAYDAVWLQHIQFTAGLLRSDYSKTFSTPSGATENSSKPWLYNLGLSGKITRQLEFYGSYSRGLEEAGTAPANAANPNAVLNTIIVTQREVGIKAKITPTLNLVFAGFDTRKPYAGIDTSTGIFGIIGNVRHRGLEASLSGEIANGLSVVVGGVVMDAELSGSDISSGFLGDKPVGVPSSRFIASLNYSVPMIAGLSVDLGVTSLGKQAASSRLVNDEQLMLPRQTQIDTGLRYQFDLVNQAATLRFQVQNLFNAFDWKVSNAETFDYIPQRRFRLVLTTEF